MEGTELDRDERLNDNSLSIDKDSRINVVVNSPHGNDNAVDLGRVLRNLKQKKRVFAWVLLLCMTVGICAGLLSYQLGKKPTTVSAVVTLDYDIPNPLLDPAKNPEFDPSLLLDETIPEFTPVADLSAPDGTELDLSQVTSSHVLQAALSGLELSHPITLSNLRDNIRVEKILTGDSRRKQEVAASMIQDKNSSAYTQVQEIELAYENQFVVSLANGFGDEGSRVKYDLTDDELRLILDRILAGYNDYLFNSYADRRMPNNRISVIDTGSLDILESLELLRSAVTELYDYCDQKSDAVKAYRSWRTGRSLSDLMANLALARDLNVAYLYSYVLSGGIVKDREAMITSYQYQLNNAQSQLDATNEDITATQAMLDVYKNDSIYVSMQESATERSTNANTNYYNKLVAQQVENYDRAAQLEAQISDLQDKIDVLNAGTEPADVSQVSQELEAAISTCQTAYDQISSQMKEIFDSAFYTTYADHSVAQGKTESFIVGSMKRVILGALAGIVIACGLWLISALLPELKPKDEEDAAGKEAANR